MEDLSLCKNCGELPDRRGRCECCEFCGELWARNHRCYGTIAQAEEDATYDPQAD